LECSTIRSESLRIIGIDPGLNRTGYGVIEHVGGQLRGVVFGVIKSPPGPLASRLGHILAELGTVIRDTRPQQASIEKVFVNVNAQSTLLLGQARGAALCAAVSAGLVIHEYTALQVKQAVVGYGKADKLQVQKMVQRLLALPRAPVADAADALACCICHAHSGARTATLRGLAAPPSPARRKGKTGTRGQWQAFALRLQSKESR